jgi:hypothetical protein
VVIKTRSNQYLLKEGRALISPVDTGTVDLRVLELRDGEIRDEDRAPGDYRFQVFDLLVQTVDGNRSVRVPVFPTRLTITDDDIRRGSATLDLRVRGLFKVTVVDKQLKPVPNHEVELGPDTLGIDLTQNMFYATFKTDDSGAFYCLGSVFQLDIKLERNYGLLIFQAD